MAVTWSYRLLETPLGSDPTAALNNAGKEGWQLVGFYDGVSSGVTSPGPSGSPVPDVRVWVLRLERTV